jgi:hypothetical protein
MDDPPLAPHVPNASEAMKHLRMLLATESEWIPSHCRRTLETCLPVIDAELERQDAHR